MKKESMLRSRFSNQYGLSLIELMISIVLGLFLTWGAIQAFLAGKQTYFMQQNLSRIQENARLAQELIGFDVRDAGNYGCGVGKFITNYDVANMLPNVIPASGSRHATAELNFAFAVFVLNDVSGDATADTTLLAPLDPAPLAGTDVLVVHNADHLGAEVQEMPIPTATKFTTQSRNFTVNDILAVADCTKNYIFRPSAIAAGANTTEISSAGFAEAPLKGSTVMRLRSTIYYVANNPVGEPALYRRLLNGDSEELLAGVENFQIEVGIDTNNDSIVDVFNAPNAVTNAQWNAWDDSNLDGDILETSNTNVATRVEQNVVAIRYSLLLRSETNVVEEPQAYVFNGVDVTPTDRRLRQIVTSTVGIRSRTN